MNLLHSVIAVTVLALVHVYGARLTRTPAIPRSHWLSIAGGAAVGFVFLHILPELGRGQEAVETSGRFALGFLERHVYLVALLGMLAYYGVERAVKVQHPDEDDAGPHVADRIFWVHVAAFGLYNTIIGYLLVHRDLPGTGALIAFTVAVALHFLVNDHALRELHQQDYHDVGRWLLAGAVVVGWLAGLLTDLGEAMVGVLFAFVAGAIILNVLKEELPRERESKFWAFALGAIVYAALIMLVE